MKALILLILLGFVGCVQPKSERNITFNMPQEDLEVLKKHCEEINSHGDILALLREIKNDTQKVLRIMENPDYESRSELTLLAEQISERSQKVSLLSRAEWTTERWEHEIAWRIDEEDFKKSIGTFFRNGFAILDAKVDSIYLMGQLNKKILTHMSIEHQENLVVIKYKGIGSSLELCQLQKTLLVILDIHARSLNQHKHHFFNLHVR